MLPALVGVLFFLTCKLFLAGRTAPVWFPHVVLVRMLIDVLAVVKETPIFLQESTLWSISTLFVRLFLFGLMGACWRLASFASLYMLLQTSFTDQFPITLFTH